MALLAVVVLLLHGITAVVKAATKFVLDTVAMWLLCAYLC